MTMLSRRATSVFTGLPLSSFSRLARPAQPWPLSSQATIDSLRTFHSPRRRLGAVFYPRPLLRTAQLQRHPSTSHLTLHTITFLSRPFPQGRSRTFRVLYRIFTLTGFLVLFTGSFIVLFFLYDASTYNEEAVQSDVPVPERALNPKRGGPKNLPIVDCFLDDSDSPEKEKQKDKPRLVILGSGWGVSISPRELYAWVMATDKG
jgi:hypothetical protein